MKNPLAVIGFSFFIGLIFGNFFGQDISFVLLCVLLVSSIVSSFFGKKIKYICGALWSCSIALLFFCFSYGGVVIPAMNLIGSGGEIKGIITDYTEYGNIYKYTVNVQESSFANNEFKLIVTSSAYLGDELYHEIECSIEEIVHYKDPFSENIYIESDLDTDLPFVISDEIVPSLKSFSYKLNSFLSDLLYKVMPARTAQLADAMFLGNVSRDMKTAFRFAGGNHLLVVSGLHLSILSGLILKFLRRIIRGRYFAPIISILFVILYMFVSGGKSSIIRAGIMMIMLLVGEIIGREYSGINALGLAIIVIGISSPLEVLNISTLLSVSACLGIVCLAPPMELWVKRKTENKLIQRFGGSLSVVISAVLVTIPVTLAFFNQISLLSIFTSLLLEIPTIIIISGAMITAMVSIVNIPLGAPFAFIVSLFAKAVLLYVESVPNIFLVSFGELSIFVIVSLSLFIIVAIMSKAIRVKLTAVIMCILILVSSLAINWVYFNSTTRIICGPNQNGYTVLINHNNQSKIIYCGNSPSKNIDYKASDYGITPNHSLKWQDLQEGGYILRVEEKLIVLELMGKTIALDRGYNQPVECDILITNKQWSVHNSMFTIIPENDIIDLENYGFSSGSYVFTNDILVLDITADGEIKFIDKVKLE